MIQKINTIIRDIGSFSNVPRRLQYALTRPQRAWNYLSRTGSNQWINRFFDSYLEYQNLLSEIERSELVLSIEEKLTRKFAIISGHTSRGNPYIPGIVDKAQAFNVYTWVRKHAPNVLVEAHPNLRRHIGKEEAVRHGSVTSRQVFRWCHVSTVKAAAFVIRAF